MTDDARRRRPSPDSWPQVSALLDVAMELPHEARSAWLASLTDIDPASAAAVAAWMGELDAMQAAGFLEERLEAGPAPATAGTQVGVYRLVEPIGQGGMGTVWLADRSDGRFEQRAAVKLLHMALPGSSASEHFAREAGILARLTHPQIAHLLDAGISAAGVPYLVIEHVDGDHIDRYCDDRRLGVRDRVRVFLDVLTPVAHAHANLVVHRDLKPSNVLVSRDGHVKLLDFGIAKLLQPDAGVEPHVTVVTREGALTPACAAPEQLTGGAVTTRTDVYALGVLLYQLLTGRHPSASGPLPPAALVKNIVEASPARASEVAMSPPVAAGETAAELAARRGTTPARLRDLLADDLDTVLATALKKDPAERYASVTALADDLGRWLRDEPIAARPDSLAYRGAKFVRRHRPLVALAAVAVVALVAGLAGTVTQARRATAQAQAAEEERARADHQAADATAQRDFARRQLARAEAINDLNAFLIADVAPVGTSFTARELLARAERIVSRQQDEEEDVRAEVLVSLGRLYAVLGETTNSTRLLEQAYAVSRGVEDAMVRAQASCALATVVVRTGALDRATALLDEGLDGLPDGPEYGASRVFCHLCAANVRMWSGDGARAVEHARAAQAAAVDSGTASPLQQLRIVMELAEALRHAGRLREADQAFADAQRRLVALGREDTERAGTLLNNWGLVLLSLGRPRDAEQMLRRSVAISTDTTAARVDPVIWNNLAQALFDLDRVPEAIRFSARAYAEAHADGDALVADQAQLTRARFHITRGEVAAAARLLAEVEARFTAVFPPTHGAFVALGIEQARLAEAQGRLADAAAHAERVLALSESSPALRGILPRALRHRAAVAARQGRADIATVSAERALALTLERVGADAPSLTVGLAYLTLGEAHAAGGRAAEAAAALTTALEHLDATVGPDNRQTRLARRLLRASGTTPAASRRPAARATPS